MTEYRLKTDETKTELQRFILGQLESGLTSIANEHEVDPEYISQTIAQYVVVCDDGDE